MTIKNEKIRAFSLCGADASANTDRLIKFGSRSWSGRQRRRRIYGNFDPAVANFVRSGGLQLV